MRGIKTTINFQCGHSEELTCKNKSTAEQLVEKLFNIQGGLCIKCYAANCRRNKRTPWWSKKKGE